MKFWIVAGVLLLVFIVLALTGMVHPSATGCCTINL